MDMSKFMVQIQLKCCCMREKWKIRSFMVMGSCIKMRKLFMRVNSKMAYLKGGEWLNSTLDSSGVVSLMDLVCIKSLLMMKTKWWLYTTKGTFLMVSILGQELWSKVWLCPMKKLKIFMQEVVLLTTLILKFNMIWLFKRNMERSRFILDNSQMDLNMGWVDY